MPITDLSLTDASSDETPFALTISDPNLDDNPLVYVSDAFEKVTGYTRTAVIGRNCRFLQGKETSDVDVARIRDAIRNEEEVQVDIYNYRADGDGFWNRLYVAPLRDNDGIIRHYVGIQHPISDKGAKLETNRGSSAVSQGKVDANSVDNVLAEIQHRVKNHLSMVVGLIRMEARKHTAKEAFGDLARRVEALQLLYSEMSRAGAGSTRDECIPLGAYLTRIAAAISHLDGRKSVRVLVDADKMDVPVETAARTGLIFSEILTNSLQHAFTDRTEGAVEARSKLLTDGVVRITVMDDGEGIPEGIDWPNGDGLGSRIVRELVNGLNANLAVERGLRGTTVNLDIPLQEQEGMGACRDQSTRPAQLVEQNAAVNQ